MKLVTIVQVRYKEPTKQVENEDSNPIKIELYEKCNAEISIRKENKVDTIYINGEEVFDYRKCYDSNFIATQRIRRDILKENAEKMTKNDYLEKEITFLANSIKIEEVKIYNQKIIYLKYASMEILECLRINFKKDSESKKICFNVKKKYEKLKKNQKTGLYSLQSRLKFSKYVLLLF